MDFGLLLRRRAQLATGVSNAAQYASLSGSGVSAATLQTITTTSSWLASATATASAPACYCPTGFPITLGAAVGCATTCASGASPAQYLTITATYVYTPLFPSIAYMTSKTLTQSATVMVR